MRRLQPYYFQFVIVLVCGMLLGTVATGSAYSNDQVTPLSLISNTLTGCVGASGTTGLTLGGRVITPSTILRISSNGQCAASENSLNLVSYANTIVVSGNSDPLTNGGRLLAAMTVISNAIPTSNNPYLLKLEPGIYDLGTSYLTMLPYLDIEGSGQDVTKITRASVNTADKATVIGANNSELRLLTVENRGGPNYALGIFNGAGIDNSLKLTNLTVIVSNGSTNSTGIYNSPGSPLIQNVTVTSTNSAGGASYGISNNGSNATMENVKISSSTITPTNSAAFGVYIVGNSAPQLRKSIITVTTTGTGTGWGIYNDGASTFVSDLNLKDITSGGGDSDAIVSLDSGQLTLENSDIVANSTNASYGSGVWSTNNALTTTIRSSSIVATASSKAGCQAFATNNFNNNSSRMNIFNSTLEAQGDINCSGSYAIVVQGTNSVTNAHNSNLKAGTEALAVAVNNSANIGASQLDNPGAVFVGPFGGTVTCVNSYKTNFTVLSNTCS